MITKKEETEYVKPKLFRFWNLLMNISPHLLIDVGILSTALTITLVLRAKGNAARKERETK